MHQCGAKHIAASIQLYLFVSLHNFSFILCAKTIFTEPCWVPNLKFPLMDLMTCRKFTNTTVIQRWRIVNKIPHNENRHWIMAQFLREQEHYAFIVLSCLSSRPEKNSKWVFITSHVHCARYSVLSLSTLYQISPFSQIYGWSDVAIIAATLSCEKGFSFNFLLELLHVFGFNLGG